MTALRRVSQWTIIASFILALILGGSICTLYCIAGSRTYGDGALLGGPGGLTILALVVALSAYLRNVSQTANETRQEIRDNDVKLYPYVRDDTNNNRVDCTLIKLSALDNTYENLHIAAFFLIAMSLTIAIRLFVETLLRLNVGWTLRHQLEIRICDALILEWVVIAFIALAVMHRRARIR